MPKAKLLFLTQTLSFPPDGGAAIRAYNVLRLLAREYDITVLCFYRRATTTDLAGSVGALRAIACTVEVFPIEQEYSRMRLAWDHTRSLVTRRAYTVYAYESDRFRAALLDQLRSTRFDVVHVDSLDLSGYLPLLAGQTVVLGHHNVESSLLHRRAANESSPPRRAYMHHQARLTEREERRWLSRVALNVAVSDGDARDLAALAPAARMAVVPNGVDVEKFVPAGSGERSGIVFVGGMSWFPNADALEYFAQEILPLIRASDSAVSVTWVGRASQEEIERYAKMGIRLTGHVDDIRPIVDRAACCVVPLRIGGGTRLKILDGWAMGKAIVSTSIGCEGLDAIDGKNILVRDDPRSFALAVLTVLRDPLLRASLEREGRVTAERTYSWEVIGAAIRRAYGNAH
jgi:glycosyltransferase involved in cell wall biosynthesis